MGQPIRDSINKWRKGNINNANQAGCTGNRSCQSKLTSSFNEIMSSVDKGNQVVVMDVCTACELVPQSVLIKKPEQYNVRTTNLPCINNQPSAVPNTEPGAFRVTCSNSTCCGWAVQQVTSAAARGPAWPPELCVAVLGKRL